MSSLLRNQLNNISKLHKPAFEAFYAIVKGLFVHPFYFIPVMEERYEVKPIAKTLKYIGIVRCH